MCNGCNTGNGGCGGCWLNTLFNGCSQRVCRDACGNLRVIGGCGCSSGGTFGCGSYGSCARTTRCGCWQTTTTTEGSTSQDYACGYGGCGGYPCCNG